jgi:hypothetical protein
MTTAPNNSFSALLGSLGITLPPPSEAHTTASHRASCLAMAARALPDGASVYDRIAAADYLENGFRVEPEPQECSCQTAEASHPRGDEAYCEMRQ